MEKKMKKRMNLTEAYAPTLAEGSLDSVIQTAKKLPPAVQVALSQLAKALEGTPAGGRELDGSGGGAAGSLKAKTMFMQFVRDLDDNFSKGADSEKTVDMKGIQSSSPSPAKTAAKSNPPKAGGMVGKSAMRVG